MFKNPKFLYDIELLLALIWYTTQSTALGISTQNSGKPSMTYFALITGLFYWVSVPIQFCYNSIVRVLIEMWARGESVSIRALYMTMLLYPILSLHET